MWYKTLIIENVGQCIYRCIQNSQQQNNIELMKFDRPLNFENVALSLDMREVFATDIATICLVVIAGTLMMLVIGFAISQRRSERQYTVRARNGLGIELSQMGNANQAVDASNAVEICAKARTGRGMW